MSLVIPLVPVLRLQSGTQMTRERIDDVNIGAINSEACLSPISQLSKWTRFQGCTLIEMQALRTIDMILP